MKKLLIIIFGILLIGTNIPTVSAQGTSGTPDQTQTPDPLLNARQEDQDQLRNSTSQRDTIIKQRNTLETEREALQTTLTTQRQQRDALPVGSPGRTALDTSIKSLESGLTEKDKQIQSANQTISELDQKIENNVAYKIEQINQKYDALESSTAASAVNIEGVEKKQCLDQAGSNADKQKFCNDYYGLLKQANEDYTTFLQAQRKLEICRANPSCRDKPLELKKFEDATKAASALVAATLSKITQMEIQRNQHATFDVSDIFSLRENTPANDVEPTKLLDVTNTIADWLITLVSSLAVTALIIGGFIMIISGGDENRLEMGKTIFIYALIGLVITLMSYGIITFIQSLFYPEASNIPPGQPSSVETPASPTPAPVQEGVDFIPPPDPALGLPS